MRLRGKSRTLRYNNDNHNNITVGVLSVLPRTFIVVGIVWNVSTILRIASSSSFSFASAYRLTALRSPSSSSYRAFEHRRPVARVGLDLCERADARSFRAIFVTAATIRQRGATAVLSPSPVVVVAMATAPTPRRRSSRLSAAKENEEVSAKATNEDASVAEEEEEVDDGAVEEEVDDDDEKSRESSSLKATTTATKKRKAAAKKKTSPPKKKTKKKISKTSGSEDDEDDASVVDSPKTKTKKKAAKTKKTKKKAETVDDASGSDDDDDDDSKTSATKKKKKMMKKTTTTKKKKAPAHQVVTERDPLPKLWDAEKAKNEKGSYTFKVCSWNVAGLRALLRNHPDALPNLVAEHDLDVLCLQETKLQEMHVDDPKLRIRGHLLEPEGYDAYYSCSTAKKGYSGTAVFVRRRCASTTTKTPPQEGDGDKPKPKKQSSVTQFFAKKQTTTTTTTTEPDAATTDQGDDAAPVAASSLPPPSPFDDDLTLSRVTYGIHPERHADEGRAITAEFPLFSLTNLYVPNSGQKLERLDYRTLRWDVDLVEHAEKLRRERGVPVVWLGDLNVAHLAADVWNDGAKHLTKSAGTTPEERASFQRQLEHVCSDDDDGPRRTKKDADAPGGTFVDAFRYLHPNARAHYTYWSQRAGNREPNKGLRLDYFVCDRDLMVDDGRVTVRDSYMLPERTGSDHCPIVLEMEVKTKKEEREET